MPALLYADDMVMFAEEEEGLVVVVVVGGGGGGGGGLKVLEEWYEKWSVKVNAGKCDMHFRKKRAKRSKEKFSVNVGREMIWLENTSIWDV